jgi:hypothetical protein
MSGAVIFIACFSDYNMLSYFIGYSYENQISVR